MQKKFRTGLTFIVVLVSFLTMGTLIVSANDAEKSGRYPQVIWQNSPTIGLLNGLYDGLNSVAEIRAHGDFGLGTWDRLNGEGLIIDGVFYEVHSDGTVHVMPDTATLPWVSITFFNPERELELETGLTLTNLTDRIDPLLPTINSYYAVRVDGEFDIVETRSLPEQSKPYPPFCEVEKTEPKFHFRTVKGTMVGFRSPPFSTNMSVPNWHLHFLNEDRSGGGHVLGFVLRSGKMKLDKVDDIDIEIPDTPAYNQANLNSIIQCN